MVLSSAAARRGVLAAFFLLAAGSNAPIAAEAAAPVPPSPPAAPAAAVPGGPVVMFDARVVGDRNRSRFIADLTGNIDTAVFALADPYRVVIDLPDVGFRLPETAGADVRGLVSAFRYGSISSGKSRIVLDLTGPVAIDKSFVVPAENGQPARLVVDVVPTSRKTFLDKVRAYRDSQAVAVAAKRDRELIAPERVKGEKLVVVLDPGHGGIDTGTYGVGGTVEKEVALGFAKVLGQKLVDTGLYDVFYTRSDDTFVALGDRVEFARSHHADLLVSIHANTFSASSVSGAIVYTISDEASDKVAAEVADSENRSDVLAGLDIAKEDSEDVKDILVDLTRRETRNFGVVFAQNLVKELKGGKTRMFKLPHQQAGFRVLESPDVPSVLLELGFMSNADDEKQLNSPEWRANTADSVVRAIAGYFKTHVAVRTDP